MSDDNNMDMTFSRHKGHVSNLLGQARAGFGIFVSDGIVEAATSSTDMLELAFATFTAIMLLWEYGSLLHQWQDSIIGTGHLANSSWRVTEILVDTVDLVQSVAVFLAVRMVTDLGTMSIETSVSSLMAAVTSVLMFVTIDSFLKARRRVPSNVFSGTTSLATMLTNNDSDKAQSALLFWVPFF